MFAAITLFALANGALINMIMASRLVYGMSEEGIVPGFFGRILQGRRTPITAIVFTTVLGLILVSTGDLGDLADTTVLLLLVAFTVVNISVLVLRRTRSTTTTSARPIFAPILGGDRLGRADRRQRGRDLPARRPAAAPRRRALDRRLRRRPPTGEHPVAKP